ncbi:hypothetical protein SAMN05877838_2759 [Hoeflea halophila]|uniref:4-amino-4-deoxy-L-arabinose transferase-like glycosyltransferase n=1 Tax=Hoeflea halophila TaxID=714899 RepID=A0A286IEY1_9HYPH|nr:hypothetical protein [Hoeflea halophila]SOE17854.1 hypothetical protein SAMN05877838_2759 [Hoeflea halophila]
MTETSPAESGTGIADTGSRDRTRISPFAPLHRPVLLTFVVFIIASAGMHFATYVDYVGADNDDVMRLVQVRDLLSGQGWFDLTQYRLGLEGGTLMHWSRLIDLPIANLVMLFSLFMGPVMAEASALFVWPLLTTLPIFYALALGGNVLAGQPGRLIALALAFLFVLGGNRFQPGSIDHHNVQLGLIATIAACLMLPGRPPLAHAIAGGAAALAIAIGAETTPHILVAALIVAIQWLWIGRDMKAAASVFALAMAAALSAVFFLTVPPARYGEVACDALSTGFYSLGVIGAGSFFLAVSATSERYFAWRLTALGLAGTVTLGAALLIAPQCLGNPLATLDPLLVSMWLSSVTEAQSVFAQAITEPWSLAGFYLVPVLAMMLCVRRICQRRDVQAYGVLLALLAVSWAIALVQVRGAVFANLLSAIPMAALVAEMRVRANADQKNLRKGLMFAGTALAAVPFVWALSGALLSMAVNTVTGEEVGSLPVLEENACTGAAALRALAAEPAGVVASPSNMGAHILRFTAHRVLSAPYHRNQGGMLTELHAAMAVPKDAVKFLRGAGVTLVAFCKTDPQVASITRVAPDGLYAQLGQGRIPAWLEPVPGTQALPLQLYRVKP